MKLRKIISLLCFKIFRWPFHPLLKISQRIYNDSESSMSPFFPLTSLFTLPSSLFYSHLRVPCYSWNASRHTLMHSVVIYNTLKKKKESYSKKKKNHCKLLKKKHHLVFLVFLVPSILPWHMVSAQKLSVKWTNDFDYFTFWLCPLLWRYGRILLLFNTVITLENWCEYPIQVNRPPIWPPFWWCLLYEETTHW